MVNNDLTHLYWVLDRSQSMEKHVSATQEGAAVGAQHDQDEARQREQSNQKSPSSR